MKKKIDLDALATDYPKIFLKYESFCKDLSAQIKHLLEKADILSAFPIQFRAKQWQSLYSKISQGKVKIERSITEVQDLAGIRIILLFKRDVVNTISLLKDQLQVIKEYDTSDRLSDSEFGYASVHLIVKLKEEWLRVPTLSGYRNMNVEIQVRTLSQHSWAEVSNIFQYKESSNVPKELKRSISRISAVLEIIDLEFERLLIEREKYKSQIATIGFTQGNLSSDLNVDTLQLLLDSKLPPENKDVIEDYSSLLADLYVLGFDSLTTIEKLINENIQEALNEDKETVKNTLIGTDQRTGTWDFDSEIEDEIERAKTGVFYTHVGLVRIMLNHYFGEPYYLVLEKILGKDNI